MTGMKAVTYLQYSLLISVEKKILLRDICTEILKTMRYFLFLIFILVAYPGSAQTQSGYNIRFKVEGWKDTTAYLGHYLSESTYLKDTAKVNSKGEFTFEGKKALAP